jgi:hypothetical protein
MIEMLVRALGKPLVLPYAAASASWRRFLSTVLFYHMEPLIAIGLYVEVF